MFRCNKYKHFIYSEGDAIKVFVRIRPPNSYEKDIGQVQALNVLDETSLAMNCKSDSRVFTFDQVADITSTQVNKLTIRNLSTQVNKLTIRNL